MSGRSTLASGGSEQDVTRPLGPVAAAGLPHDLVLGGREADLTADAAPFLGWFGWPSGAWVHVADLIVRSESWSRGLADRTYALDNKCMTTSPACEVK